MTPAAVVKRLTAVIARFGASYTYKRGASTVSVSARVRVMTSAESYAWFTAAEVSAWARPAYTVVVGGDFLPFGGAPAAGDTITINGVVYTVKKFDKAKMGAVTVRTVLYCAA